MRKAIHDTFLRLYAENKPYEDLATQKALSYFNRLLAPPLRRRSPYPAGLGPEAPEAKGASPSPTGEEKPYEITEVQETENYKTTNYDAKLSNGETDIKIEVKTDHRSRVTGNFFIEFSQYGKASGVATTEADYYVINDTVDYYLISVQDIGEILQVMDEEDTLKVISVRSPHCKNMVTKGWLMKKSDVLKFATVLA